MKTVLHWPMNQTKHEVTQINLEEMPVWEILLNPKIFPASKVGL